MGLVFYPALFLNFSGCFAIPRLRNAAEAATKKRIDHSYIYKGRASASALNPRPSAFASQDRAPADGIPPHSVSRRNGRVARSMVCRAFFVRCRTRVPHRTPAIVKESQ
ncbi:exported hypothetical protein [uncultured Desulfovibrio sp.]|uniref:Uncharacterized protein n=1 Tax=uncultured Desulfovibrio sp. TaxID=167968 RepID=A0A212L6B8_9BACT|nr:exported hypothetical protein [uncultured Desulfovibrio sp.]VZH33938.1 conserved protein of unknown function [Desulfovibrio sp. 86]